MRPPRFSSHNLKDRRVAEIHFVTGKGGVGKSSVAAALASHLEKSGQGPVLLIEVQGSGHSLELLRVDQIQFNNTHVPGHTNLWAARILPKESFKQYFGVLLGLGGQSTLAMATNLFKERIVELVVENKIVSAFIDVCPGLEPAVLLGKIHWEATQGHTPEEKIPWRHVVVDAPATGHGVMLFKSTFAMTEVFSRGVFFRAATEIKEFVRSPKDFHIYLVSTPEELPLRESVEMLAALKGLELPRPKVVINRYTSAEGQSLTPRSTGLPAEWQREVDFERESISESAELLGNFFRDLPAETVKYFLPEIVRTESQSFLVSLREQLGEQIGKPPR